MSELTSANCCSSREKYWKELSVEEKVERMRDEIKRRDSKITGLTKLLDRVFNWARYHKHVGNEMVMPVERDNNALGDCEREWQPSREQEKNGEVRF